MLELYNNFKKRMFLAKKLKSSSTNLKYRIKSQPKDTSKQNIHEPVVENNRKKGLSLFQKQKIAGNRKPVNNGRRGLAGLKPLDFKGSCYPRQNNGLVIQSLLSTQNKVGNKKDNGLKLNFVEDSRKSFTATTQKESQMQMVNEKMTSLQRLKQNKSPAGDGQLEDKNGLFSMSNTFSENEIDQINETEQRVGMQQPERKESVTVQIQLDKIMGSKHRIQSKTVDLFLLVDSTQLMHKYQQLTHEVHDLQQKYAKLKYRIGQLDEANEQTKSQFTSKAKFLAEFDQKYRAEEEKLQRIKKELQNKTIQLEDVIQKGKEIENYVTTQSKRKLLHEVSEDYKKKEGDMYDYALQMQTSTWATGLKEVKPFALQEKYLFDRMNALERELGNDQNLVSFETKCNEIKDFVSKMYASFKRMNDDMRAVNDFKTKCIRQFVLRMQNWLQNWQLKQQFLVNLRQDFAIEQMRIDRAMVELQRIMQGKGMMISQQQKYIELKISLEKMRENYKLGNSFY